MHVYTSHSAVTIGLNLWCYRAITEETSKWIASSCSLLKYYLSVFIFYENMSYTRGMSLSTVIELLVQNMKLPKSMIPQIKTLFEKYVKTPELETIMDKKVKLSDRAFHEYDEFRSKYARNVIKVSGETYRSSMIATFLTRWFLGSALHYMGTSAQERIP